MPARFSDTSSGGRSPFQVGAVALVVISILIYLGFSKDIPFVNDPYQLKAVFADAQNMSKRSPVRIAGVEVGQVTKIEEFSDDSDLTVVTMELKDDALPLHEDAELKIRPRIFLEGNFFVELDPGSPSGPELADGSTIPAAQTSGTVQLDEILTSLQSDTRADLQRLLQGYGDAVNGEPLPGEDADQEPMTRGETASESLHDSIPTAADALRGIAIVNEAIMGTELHDLSTLVASTAQISGTLAAKEEQLKDFVTNFNRTMAAFAAEEDNLRRTIAELPEVLERAGPALDELNQSFPPVRAFAREILPGVRATPDAIDASFPWIRQVRALVSPAELQGLVNDLRPAIDDLAQVTNDSIRLLPKVDDASRCFIENVLPAGDVVIDGPPGYPHETGVENYKEFWQSQVALSGESQNFDGNGGYTRFQPGGGDQTFTTTNTRIGGAPLFTNPSLAPIGSLPKYPAKRPPYRRDVKCFNNDLPRVNENAVLGGGP
jgi:phospholipid/cholesterol/gamma-HCH transport system substrate-binding protein